MHLTLDITCPAAALESLLTVVRSWEALNPDIGVIVTVQTPDLTPAEAKALLARVGLGHFRVLTAI